MKRLAIIPARGGSKRIPRKNVKPFLGKPMLAYSVETALESGLFDEVMVSTDDPEIAETAERYGAKVPFVRSAATADDHAALSDVIAEVLDEYEKRGERFDAFCCLLATAPLLRGERLEEAWRLMTRWDYDSVFPVVRFGYPVQRCLRIAAGEEEEGRVSMVWPEYARSRSQDLEPRYHDSGQFYWMRTDRFRRQGTLFAARSGAIVLPETEVQDIDTPEDWAMAELKYRLLREK